MTEHTPRPWRFEESTKTIRACPTNYWLATMDSFDGAVDHKANARLIAAAPDLLMLIENWHERLTDGRQQMSEDQIEEWAVEARAAIAKATEG